MTAHVPLRQLADLRDGLLVGARLRAAEAHLARGCAECAERVAGLERVIDAIGGGTLPEPPRRAASWTTRLFGATWGAVARRRPREQEARLVRDRSAQLLPGVRAAVGDTRRTLWRVPEGELVLAVRSAPGGAAVEGQWFPEDGDEAEVRGSIGLLDAGGEIDRTRLAAFGRFTFERVRAGACSLRLHAGAVRCFVPLLVID